jgi:hypothetical protein
MSEVEYGVVQRNGRWTIVGAHLRYGAYERRGAAIRAVVRLAKKSAGLPVRLYVQGESGELTLLDKCGRG